MLMILFVALALQSAGALRLNKASPHLPILPTTRALKPQANHPVITSSAASSASVDKEGQQSGLLPPWLPSFGTAALGGLLFGSDIGATSSVVRILGANTADFGALNSAELGQIASSSLIGAMAASAFLIFQGDKQIGRKLELKVASILFIAGTLSQSLAPTLPLLLCGRVVYGLGIGFAMHVAPLFIAETAPNDLRGKLVSYKEAAIVMGIVLGYAAGALWGGDNGWRGVYESVLPLEALMLAGAFAVPESPRWLALRQRPEEAKEALMTIQGLSEERASEQVKEMTTMTFSAGNKDGAAESDTIIDKLNAIVSSPYNRQALVIGVGLVLFQQLSGQPSVLYFANRIFEKAGLGFEAALGVGVFKLIMTLVSANLVESPQWGRRTLLLYGNAGITVSLVGLSLFYYLGGISPDGPNQAGIIACILAFVGCYQIGFGPITWLVLSEIFPLQIRSAAVSVGTLANFGSNLLIAGVFETEREALGEPLLFAQFALIALLATIFTNYYVFETRGLSLEEIEAKLKRIVDKE